MNPLTKLVTIATLWGCVALGVGTAADPAAMGSGEGSSLRASLAAEVRDQLTRAFALERLIRQATTRAVVIDGNHMVVEASRLPRELSSEAWRYAVRIASTL